MREHLQFYIDGAWVAPESDARLEIINPANEAVAGHIALGNAQDVDKAARRAFGTWSRSTPADRIELFGAILAEYQKAPARPGRCDHRGNGCSHCRQKSVYCSRNQINLQIKYKFPIYGIDLEQFPLYLCVFDSLNPRRVFPE